MKYLVIIFLLGSICNKMANAQNDKSDYLSQANVSAGYLPVLSFKSSSLPYSPTNMYRISLGANYGKGFFKTHFLYGEFITRDNNLANCNAFGANLAYQYHIPVSKFLSIYSGIETGLHFIHFQTDDVPFYSKNETEMIAGGEAGIEAKLNPKLSLTGSCKIQRIFSTPRFNLILADVGIVYYFNKSETVKRWLQ